jgi:hypothetical protein
MLRVAALCCIGISSVLCGRERLPFGGCNSDGQVGPLSAPARKTMRVLATPAEAGKLAYYKAAKGIGVLAPRGWHCFGTYGSGGDTLFVAPDPIHPAQTDRQSRSHTDLAVRPGDASQR